MLPLGQRLVGPADVDRNDRQIQLKGQQSNPHLERLQLAAKRARPLRKDQQRLTHPHQRVRLNQALLEISEPVEGHGTGEIAQQPPFEPGP